jgi:hypothetical protein
MEVEIVADAAPGKNGVASGQWMGRLVIGVVVGEMAGEEDVEMTLKKTLRYGGGLSGMRAGRYGTGNVREGSGCRVAGDGATTVGVERRECELEASEAIGCPAVDVISCSESFVLRQNVKIRMGESSSKKTVAREKRCFWLWRDDNSFVRKYISA